MANNLPTNKDETLWRFHEYIIKRLLELKETDIENKEQTH